MEHTRTKHTPDHGLVSYPMIFSGESVRQILAGKKTQTRRRFFGIDASTYNRLKDFAKVAYKETYVKNSRIRVGTVLWVREKWYPALADHECVGYESTLTYRCGKQIPNEGKHVVWDSPIYMPRAYSRISLIVTGVRAELLHEISAQDIEAEGIATASIEEFEKHWDAINAKRGYPFSTNPWVRVYEFRILEQESDTRHENGV